MLCKTFLELPVSVAVACAYVRDELFGPHADTKFHPADPSDLCAPRYEGQGLLGGRP